MRPYGLSDEREVTSTLSNNPASILTNFSLTPRSKSRRVSTDLTPYFLHVSVLYLYTHFTHVFPLCHVLVRCWHVFELEHLWLSLRSTLHTRRKD